MTGLTYWCVFNIPLSVHFMSLHDENFYYIPGYYPIIGSVVNSLRPRQNGRLFTDDTFKRTFLNENIRISTKTSLKFVSKGLINNIPALVLKMAWCRPDDKPLSEPMLVRSLTHICVTRPQWVNWLRHRCVLFCDVKSISHKIYIWFSWALFVVIVSFFICWSMWNIYSYPLGWFHCHHGVNMILRFQWDSPEQYQWMDWNQTTIKKRRNYMHDSWEILHMHFNLWKLLQYWIYFKPVLKPCAIFGASTYLYNVWHG